MRASLHVGLIISALLHAALLGWTLFTVQTRREVRTAEPEPVSIEFTTPPSEFTSLRQGVRNAKQLEAQQPKETKSEEAKKEAPKPAPVAAAPPPPPPPPPPPKEEPKQEEPPKEVAAVPPPPAAPPPVPAPEEQKKLDDLLKEQEHQAEEQRKAEEQKQAEEAKKQAELKKKLDEAKKKKEAELKKKREEERKRREAEAKKKQFDAENISALLNKIPDKGGPRPSVPLDEQAKAKGPVLGAPEGRDKQLSASELAVLAQIIKACVQSRWNVQAGGEATVDTLVKLRLRFNPDGTLAGEPVVMNSQNTPMFVVLSEGAKRAAQACQPYSLPPEKYEVWKDIVLNFSLRDMVR